MLDIARNHNAASIDSSAKPLRSRCGVLHGSIVDKLIREGEGISVYDLHGEPENESRLAVKTAARLGMPHLSWHHFLAGFYDNGGNRVGLVASDTVGIG